MVFQRLDSSSIGKSHQSDNLLATGVVARVAFHGELTIHLAPCVSRLSGLYDMFVRHGSHERGCASTCSHSNDFQEPPHVRYDKRSRLPQNITEVAVF